MSIARYVKEFDGIRALAIISVLLFHLHLKYCSVGWAGVYVFFTLSGFLITGILIDNKQNSNYFKNFYLRRALRIFPIYYLVLFFCLLYALFTKEPTNDLFYYIFYLQNYLLAIKGWAADFPNLFNNSWSLAVEEQFYLIWPIVVFYFSKRNIFLISFFLIFISIAVRMFFLVEVSNVNLALTTLPSCIDSLVIGALGSILVKAKITLTKITIVKYSYFIFLLSTIVIFLIIRNTGINNYWQPALWLKNFYNTILSSIISLFSVSLIILCYFQCQPFSPIFSNKFLIHIGKISYGLYIYHFPIFLLMDRIPNINFLTMIILKIIITYAISLMSWLYIEKYFIKLKGKLA